MVCSILKVSSAVPEGKGVSSSAALEVATMSAIAAAYGKACCSLASEQTLLEHGPEHWQQIRANSRIFNVTSDMSVMSITFCSNFVTV